VRSQEKADKIADSYPEAVAEKKLDFAIVEDIAKEGAFDKIVAAGLPFEYVIHTASPFHFNVTDVQKQLLDPAIIGTSGLLKSIKAHAPTVSKVVITSSFAAIVDGSKGDAQGYTYSEKDWNPVTAQQALESPYAGYRASKTLAERAAWDFVEKEKPNFTLSTMNPPLVLGPVIHHLKGLHHLNTSNERIRDMIHGKFKNEIPNTGIYIFVDVRDLAKAHIEALGVDEAVNKRFFVTAGYFSNKSIASIIRKNFPELADKLPSESTSGGDYPGGSTDNLYKYDNSRTSDILGIPFRSLEECIIDTVKSLQAIS